MRSTLDGIELEPLHEAFADLFWELQRSGELRKWHFDDKYYLVAIDGRGYFCSSKIKCEHCLEQRKKTGSEYYHQVVAAVLVHPTRKQVVPLAVEPIEKQDGSHKNDCERNATKRLLKRLRKQHPKLNMLIIEDGLASNAAHISDLKAHGLHYLLGAKLGDHEHLFTQFERCPNEDEFASVSLTIGKPGKTLETETTFCSQSELNKSNPEVKVNFLSHLETDAKTRDVAKRFSWVTDLQIAPEKLNSHQVAGRCRWRIENETFNTLKNQGYDLEHNYGHGKKSLSTVLVLFMFLAFTVDQIQESCCKLFQAAIDQAGRRLRLWESIRSHLRHFEFVSFADLFRATATGRLCKPPPAQPPRCVIEPKRRRRNAPSCNAHESAAAAACDDNKNSCLAVPDFGVSSGFGAI